MFYKYFNFNFSSLLASEKTDHINCIKNEIDATTLYVLLLVSLFSFLLALPVLGLLVISIYTTYKSKNISMFIFALISSLLVLYIHSIYLLFVLISIMVLTIFVLYKTVNLTNKYLLLWMKFLIAFFFMQLSIRFYFLPKPSDLSNFAIIIPFSVYLLENYRPTVTSFVPKYKINIYFKLCFMVALAFVALTPLYYVPFNIGWATLLLITRCFNNIPDITFYFLLYAIIFTSLLFAVYWWLKIYFFVAAVLHNLFLHFFTNLINRRNFIKPSVFIIDFRLVDFLKIFVFLSVCVVAILSLFLLYIYGNTADTARNFLDKEDIFNNLFLLYIAIILVQLKYIFLAKNEQAWFTKIIVHLETISVLNIFKTLVIWYIISIIAVCVCFLLGYIVNLQLITISTDFLPSSLDINIFKNNVNTYYFYELIYRKLWF